MCGIFGIFNDKNVTNTSYKNIIKSLYKLSMTRGRDSSGIAILDEQMNLAVHRRNTSPDKFIQSARFNDVLNSSNTKNRLFLGHSRLATNGPSYKLTNNQPQYTKKSVCLHNGIITNIDDLWQKFSFLNRDCEVDSEIIPKYFDYLQDKGKNSIDSMKEVIESIEGTASLALFSKKNKELILATNNGSLYYTNIDQAVFFASERLILNNLLTKHKVNGEIVQLKAGGIIIFKSDITINNIIDTEGTRHKKIQEIQRCTKCILPSTFPGISFDNQGTCNFCNNYKKTELKSKDELKQIVDELKNNKSGRCISMFSGGRDSCYQLHILAKELGLNPIAYTYDWGMVTDIARRNASRLCQKLGIEHIIISADIRKKRKFIRKNLKAWLKKPHLGMLPVLMAGDKEFLYYGNKIRIDNNLDRTFFGACPFEKTNFKTGFTGVKEGGNNVYSISTIKKVRLAIFYTLQILSNPSYINSSLWDNFKGFLSAYIAKHNFVQLFDYYDWNEVEVDKLLKDQYDWENDPSFSSTWRIGDGTAAFYNYAYYILAGFSEFDTFRSNQIREGRITRDQALELIKDNNKPRWESLEWYSNVVGFDLAEAINSIHECKSLYE